MSDKELEVIEDAEVLETEDEDLLEFKASMGDPSEVPDPKTKKTDEKPKGKGDPMPKLSTKAGMINAAVEMMSKMKKEDLKTLYGKAFTAEDVEEDETVEQIVDEAPRELATITADDIDVSEDIDAMFKDSELDEDFKSRVATIFEAAVVSKVNEQIEKFAIEVESDVEVSKTEIVDELTEKVDSYLDYVVQEWVEENRLAIEKGVRADMVEDFLKGLKGLFEEHYVDIPEEKVDVVEELIAKVDELEEKLSEETDRAVELLKKVKVFEQENIFSGAIEGLTQTQVDKLRGLAEGIEFVSEEDFKKKINMLKKQYFDIDETVNESVIVTDDEFDPISLEEEEKGLTGAMAHYMSAISRSAKN